MSNDYNPLVSLCLVTYNQEAFVDEAVEGVLSQTYSPLEIIISDDASSDSTAARIKRRLDAYAGPHTVILNFNTKNMGLAAHINLLTHSLSSGELIALAAGDDISAPDRIAQSVEFLKKNPEVMAVSTSLRAINAEGETIFIRGLNERKKSIYYLGDYCSDPLLHINGPSRMFRRVVANTFGPLHGDCPTEDSTYLLRCFLLGGVAVLSDELVKYRIHGNNMSAPGNIHKLSLSRMKMQYLFDLKTASVKLRLTENAQEEIRKRIEKNMFSRIATNESLRGARFSRLIRRAIAWISAFSR